MMSEELYNLMHVEVMNILNPEKHLFQEIDLDLTLALK